VAYEIAKPSFSALTNCEKQIAVFFLSFYEDFIFKLAIIA